MTASYEPLGAAVAVRFDAKHPRDPHAGWSAAEVLLDGKRANVVLETSQADPFLVAYSEADAQWIASRLNRASWLEAAIISLASGLVQHHNHAVAEKIVPGVSTQSLMDNLLRIWNGPESAPAGQVVN